MAAALEAAGRLRDREQPLRHGHLREPRLGPDGFLQARRLVQHPGRAGRRHGRPRRLRGRTAGDRARPLGQGSLHPRDADLPLSRPLHVRPGEVPHQGRGHADARGARSDRAGAPASPGELEAVRGRAQGDRRQGARDRQRGGGVRHARSRARPVRAVHRHPVSNPDPPACPGDARTSRPPNA